MTAMEQSNNCFSMPVFLNRDHSKSGISFLSLEEGWIYGNVGFAILCKEGSYT